MKQASHDIALRRMPPWPEAPLFYNICLLVC
jgi:hypothetical protein